MSYTTRVKAVLGLKFANFRYHGDKGPSGLNVNDTVELPDLENPLVGARLLAISVILAEL